ncbi:MAG: ATP-binding protein [Candidatus Marinimicrobia bacterium]|nr:ATP-binding protein [Candidatus Neomarinimicrobiota bacterium]
MNIYDFNPWWETGTVPESLAKPKKREIYDTLRSSIEKRRIDVITGLRRVGKTTIMYQLIETLLRNGTEPRNILYYSFDLKRQDISEVIKTYEEKILKDRMRNRKVYIFLDEIHKLKDWADKIKIIYDLNPHVKILLSGSASLNIMRGVSESLAGRAKYHYLPPLTFREYLNFTDTAIPRNLEDYELYAKSLAIMFERFRYRGFPETINMDENDAREYVRELVVERVIYRDIPECFHIQDLEVLTILADYILENPGVILNIESLSSDLRRHRKTIRSALQYLEMSYISEE